MHAEKLNIKNIIIERVKKYVLRREQKVSFSFVSLLPIVVLIILLFFTIRLFGADALGGGSQICLLVTTALCAGIGMVGYHIPGKI